MKNNYISYITGFVFLSIIVGPASPVFSLQHGVFIILLYVIFDSGRALAKINVWLFFLCVSILMSYPVSLISGYQSNFMVLTSNDLSLGMMENIKRLGYLLIAVVIYYGSRKIFLNNAHLRAYLFPKVLVFTCLLYLGLAIVFVINVELFYEMKGFFFTVNVDKTDDIALERAGYLLRYPFILLDPNNGGYFTLMIAIYLFERAVRSRHQGYIGAAVAFLSPLLSMSSGVLLSYLIFVLLKFRIELLLAISHLRALMVSRRFLYIIAAFVIALFIVFFNLTFFSDLGAISRLIDKSDESDPRLLKYSLLFINDLPPLIGNGYLMFLNGQIFLPHSDHLRFLFGYGLIPYLLVVIILLRNINFVASNYFFIPAVMAFTLNSLIDESRFLFVFAILIAHAQSDLKKMGSK